MPSEVTGEWVTVSMLKSLMKDPKARRQLLKQLSMQWRKNNAVRFDSQLGAPNPGGYEVPWRDYETSTVEWTDKQGVTHPRRRASAYRTADGNKIDPPRDIFYDGKARGQLLRDTGRLRASVALLGPGTDVSGEMLEVIGSKSVTLGSRVPYARRQHRLRSIFGISRKDIADFRRVMIWWFKNWHKMSR